MDDFAGLVSALEGGSFVIIVAAVIIEIIIFIIVIRYFNDVPKHLKDISETLRRQTDLMEAERWERHHAFMNSQADNRQN